MDDEAAATLPSARPVAAPRVVAGRYRITRPLGAGTTKTVYQAHDARLGRDVALAVIAGGALGAAGVEDEVRTLAQLESPHIVTVHDFGEDGDSTFIVSQLVRGGSVADWIARADPGPARVRTAVDIARQVARALTHAHAHGVVHRDVKPSNVLLAPDGTALLADFGVALLADRGHAGEQGPVGSALYMAPEQVEGRAVDARSDLYALGVTLYEMVCGEPPFTGRPFAVMRSHLSDEPPDPRGREPAVPDALAAVIARLLAKEPAQRPTSAWALDADLAGVLAGAAPAARPRRFVGREDALAVVRAAWERSAASRPALTLVCGEAGIGKTTLASAFAEEAARGGARVLHGRCDEEALVSYQPFSEALRALFAADSRLVDRLDSALEPELSELSRLIPELRGRFPGRRGGEPERYALFEAFVEVFLTATDDARMLLVVDDLQWADRPTALLLRHILRRVGHGRLLVLGTVRTPGADPLADVRADLRRDLDDPGRLARVDLHGLDLSATEALVAARGRAVLDAGFVGALHETTSGNPFFIEETLRHLRGRDLSTPALASLGVPEGAAEVIEQRLRQLDAPTEALLTHAAVCGRRFRLDVLTEVLGKPARELVEPLRRALDAGLVVEPALGRYVFCHALVRETLYARMDRGTRAQRHLAVAEALEEVDGPRAVASELALHFHAARRVGGAEGTVRYALLAAQEAAASAAYEEAAAHQRRALHALGVLFPQRLDEHYDVLDTLGRLHWQSGDRSGARAVFWRKAAMARALGNPEQLARASLGFAGRWYDAEHVDRKQIALLEEARSLLPPEDSPTRAKVMARLAAALRPDDHDGSAAQLNRDALAMARRTGDEEAVMDALAGLHAALLHIEHLPERLALSEEWVRLSERGEHRAHTLATALHWRIADLYEVGDMEAAQALRGRLRELAESLRQPLYHNFASSWDAKWLEAEGDFDAAEAKAEESYRFGLRAQTSYARSLRAGQAFALLRDRGRLEAVIGVVEQVMGAAPTLSAWRAGLVLAEACAGRHELARRGLAELIADDFAAIPRDDFWLPAMCFLAEACALLGDADAARTLAAQLEPYAERNAQMALAGFLGPVGLFLGLLAATAGRPQEAERRLRDAIVRSAALGLRTSETHARCAYGELLATRGDPRARAQLDGARATARAFGMEAIARRAAEGLARAA